MAETGGDEGGRERRAAAEVASQIATEFSHELGACAGLESIAAAALDPWRGRTIKKGAIDDPPGADEILAMLFARATKTYKAARLLARSGYGEQASMLDRSLFEGMVVAHWVSTNSDLAAERFLRAWRFDRHLYAEVIGATGWLPEGATMAGPEIPEAELAGMKRDFGNYGEVLWTGHRSLRALVQEIESDWEPEQREVLRNFLRVANRQNSQVLHSTVAGLTEAASALTQEGLYLTVGPAKARVERALFGAYWTYAQILRVVIEHFEVPVQPEYEQMLAEHEVELRRLSADEAQGIGRNDECPCGSGRSSSSATSGARWPGLRAELPPQGRAAAASTQLAGPLVAGGSPSSTFDRGRLV